MTPPIHPLVEPIRWILGTWTGEGDGIYPTITPFRYGEEARFWHAGKPVVSYLQRTWSLADGTALHSECGFLRPQTDGRIELVLAHGFGIAEVSEGSYDGTRIELRSTAMTGTSTAKAIQSVARVFSGAGDTLTYRVEMAAVGQPLQQHLTAELLRAPE